MKKKAAKKTSAGKKPTKKVSASKKPAKKAPASKKPAKKAQSAVGRSRPQASRSPARDVNALWQTRWPEIVASAWADTPPGFRQRLLTDTRNVLKEYGLPTVEGLEYRVAEGSERFEMVLPLPSAPVMEESLTRGIHRGNAPPGPPPSAPVMPRCGDDGGDFSV
jgi:hypothetical protein